MNPPISVYNGIPVLCFMDSRNFLGRALLSQKTLFNIFGREFGLMIAVQDTDWISEKALDYIAQYFKVLVCELTTSGLNECVPWVRFRGFNDINWEKDLSDYEVLNDEGKIVGNLSWALELLKLGIYKPTSKTPERVYCSIGYAPNSKKWYGWSHRAINGYKIGDVLKAGDLATESGWCDEYLKKRPELDRRMPVGFELKTFLDCKNAAIAFSDAVS